MNIKITIEKLLKYALVHLSLDKEDEVYFRNVLLNILKVDSPYIGELNLEYISSLNVPDSLIEEVKEYLVGNNFDNIDSRLVEIMGLLSPLPSQVIKTINQLEKEEIGKGLDYLFNLSIKNNYIQKTAIDRNIYFRKDYEDNFLEITINLSKPEKNNKDIAKLLTVKQEVKYPKCQLCKENMGYIGRVDHPSRVNIRTLPLVLNNEKWFLQYSPYAYFHKHAIIINDEHSNMSINNDTFVKLLDFVNIYPCFFVGSNADLPIVGGSILNHEHYQGGEHLLPVFFSKDRKVYLSNDKVKVSIINWYNTTLRVESEDKDEVVKYSRMIFNKWISYSDKDVDVISHTNETRHNTITPIARKIGNTYQMNLILRNNRCNEIHPDGIFHAHKEYHHIKQEGIGLIEAMGLFILPPRLKRQMGYVQEILLEDAPLETYYEKYEDLVIHKHMIDSLVNQYGRNLSKEKVEGIIKDYISDTCRNILINTAVFKNDQLGNLALDKFMEEVLNETRN